MSNKQNTTFTGATITQTEVTGARLNPEIRKSVKQSTIAPKIIFSSRIIAHVYSAGYFPSFTDYSQL